MYYIHVRRSLARHYFSTTYYIVGQKRIMSRGISFFFFSIFYYRAILDFSRLLNSFRNIPKNVNRTIPLENRFMTSRIALTVVSH